MADAMTTVDEAELIAQLDAVSAAIGTTEFMDPPDGGDVSLAEQVRRMRAALTDAEARPAIQPDREAVEIAVAALERIATVDMGGGFLGALACRKLASDTLAALASAPPAPVESGWRDIATAPKDGTRFLTVGPKYGPMIVSWSVSEPFGDAPAWTTDSEGPGYSTEFTDADITHWQPLPAAPTAAQDEVKPLTRDLEEQ